jgi:RES domain-containing protein
VTPATPSVAVNARLVRVIAPKWATKPESGDGAAARGARFNAKGQPALYLSYELPVAANEYGQDMPDRPGTLCYYNVSLQPVADLTADATLKALSLTRGELAAPWKDQLSRGLRPSTWDIAAKLTKLGYVAALYESVVAQTAPSPNAWHQHRHLELVADNIQSTGHRARSHRRFATRPEFVAGALGGVQVGSQRARQV